MDGNSALVGNGRFCGDGARAVRRRCGLGILGSGGYQIGIFRLFAGGLVAEKIRTGSSLGEVWLEIFK